MYILLVHCSIIGIEEMQNWWKSQVWVKREAKPIKYKVFFLYFQISIIFSLNRIIGEKDTRAHTHHSIQSRRSCVRAGFDTLLLYGRKSMLFGIRRLFLFFQTRKFLLVFQIPIFFWKVVFVCFEHSFFSAQTFLFYINSN